MLLTSTRARAVVDLEGGRLSSLVVDGLELLVTDGDRPSRWGSFLMTPWCGRLPEGILSFEGETHQMPLNSPPHANHGLAFLQRWERVDETTIATDLAEPWPYGGRVVQRFVIEEASLTVTVEVQAGHKTMPVMAGWHPWFRRRLERGEEANLSFGGGMAYVTTDAHIPTGELRRLPPPPWDHCVVGLETPPVIEWPGALRLTISSSFDHWVIFTEPEHALCIEPHSGPPNQFHLDPRVLQPGQRLVGSMTLGWEPA
jgi:aldose 1-epimerase